MNWFSLDLLLSLLLAWVAIFICWRGYRTDKYRDQLFALRNDLFDYAARGGVDFAEPAYGILRNTMNGLIRYGDRLSFFKYLLGVVAQSANPNPIYEGMFRRWLLAVNRLDSDQQQKLAAINLQLNYIVVSNMVAGSPVLWLYVQVHRVVSWAHKLVQGTERLDLNTQLKKGVDLLEAQALEAQELETRLCAAAA
jgi:hypothetical protein